MDRQDDPEQEKSAPDRSENLTPEQRADLEKEVTKLEAERDKRITEIREQQAVRFDANVNKMAEERINRQNSPQPRPPGRVPERQSREQIYAKTRLDVTEKNRAYEKSLSEPYDKKIEELNKQLGKGREPGRTADQENAQDKDLKDARAEYQAKRNPEKSPAGLSDKGGEPANPLEKGKNSERPNDPGKAQEQNLKDARAEYDAKHNAGQQKGTDALRQDLDAARKEYTQRRNGGEGKQGQEAGSQNREGRSEQRQGDGMSRYGESRGGQSRDYGALKGDKSVDRDHSGRGR